MSAEQRFYFLSEPLIADSITSFGRATLERRASFTVPTASPPTDPSTLDQYSLTQMQARLLNLTIVIPISIIYLVALYGYLQFQSYADTINESSEGPHYAYISKGLKVLVITLPIVAIMNSLTSYVEFNYYDLYVASSIIKDYINLILTIIGILFFSKGVEGLLTTLSVRKKLPNHTYKNILHNAEKYSPDGSVVTVTVSATPKDTIVTFTDTGIGIAEDDMGKLFKKFSRAESVISTASGTGLGLYWAKKIVDLHAGKITVESTLGKGTTFSVILPKEIKP